MDFLDSLKDWFFENAKKGTNAFWTLKREHGSKWKTVSVNNETGDKDQSWEMLKNQVLSLIQNGGVTSLEVVFRLSTNDEGKSFPIKISGRAAASLGGGIAGIGNSFGGMDPWALLVQQMQYGQQSQIAALQRENEIVRKMDLLILEQQRNKSGEERLAGALERLLEKPNVTGLLERIVDRAFPDAPPIGGGSATTDQQLPSGNPAASDGSIDFNPAVKGAMKGYAAAEYPIDWNKAIDAVLLLREAGLKEPEDTLAAVAKFIAENPDAAKQMAQDMMAQTKTA